MTPDIIIHGPSATLPASWACAHCGGIPIEWVHPGDEDRADNRQRTHLAERHGITRPMVVLDADRRLVVRDVTAQFYTLTPHRDRLGPASAWPRFTLDNGTTFSVKAAERTRGEGDHLLLRDTRMRVPERREGQHLPPEFERRRGGIGRVGSIGDGGRLPIPPLSAIAITDGLIEDLASIEGVYRRRVALVSGFDAPMMASVKTAPGQVRQWFRAMRGAQFERDYMAAATSPTRSRSYVAIVREVVDRITYSHYLQTNAFWSLPGAGELPPYLRGQPRRGGPTLAQVNRAVRAGERNHILDLDIPEDVMRGTWDAVRRSPVPQFKPDRPTGPGTTIPTEDARVTELRGLLDAPQRIDVAATERKAAELQDARDAAAGFMDVIRATRGFTPEQWKAFSEQFVQELQHDDDAPPVQFGDY